MNSLSWLLYLIDVVGNAKVAAGIILVAVAMLSGARALFCFIETDNVWVPPVRWFVLAGITISILVAVPARQTMYAIAASEVGERIAMMPDTQEMSSDALKAVRSWIKTRIKDDK